MQEKYLQRAARLQYIYMWWVRPQGQWTPWIMLPVESSLPKRQQRRWCYSIRDTSNAECSFPLHRAVAPSENALRRNTVEEECFSKTSQLLHTKAWITAWDFFCRSSSSLKCFFWSSCECSSHDSLHSDWWGEERKKIRLCTSSLSQLLYPNICHCANLLLLFS